MTQEKKALYFIIGGIIVIAVAAIFGSRLTSPADVDNAAFQRAEAAIRSHYQASGTLPDALSDIDAPAETFHDRTGFPLDFQRSGKTITLTSYGGDQKPGGIMFKADKEHIFHLR